MIYPPTYPARALGRFTPEQLDDKASTCMCGRHVPLRSALVTWTHAQNSEECGFYEVCNQVCFTRHVSSGNA